MIFQLIRSVYAAEETGEAVIPNYGNSGFKYLNTETGDEAKLGLILGDLLPYIYVIAGLLLLVLLIAGGFGLMTSAGNPDKMKAGYGRIKSALIGFLIVFVSYMVVLLVQTIFGIDIGFGG